MTTSPHTIFRITTRMDREERNLFITPRVAPRTALISPFMQGVFPKYKSHAIIITQYHN